MIVDIGDLVDPDGQIDDGLQAISDIDADPTCSMTQSSPRHRLLPRLDMSTGRRSVGQASTVCASPSEELVAPFRIGTPAIPARVERLLPSTSSRDDPLTLPIERRRLIRREVAALDEAGQLLLVLPRQACLP